MSDLAAHPIVTYDPTFAGRTAVDRAFAARNLAPEIALTALDSDVIKSYVSLGLGVGIISSRAFRRDKDEGLHALSCEHLFPAQTTRLAYKRGAYLRGYTVEFIRLIAPHVRGADLKQLEKILSRLKAVSGVREVINNLQMGTGAPA